MNGEVLHIHLATEAGADPAPVDSVRAEPGRGLEGDRYFAAKGSYSGDGRSGREVTLVASEALEAAAAEFGLELAPGESRRNITTRGVDLNAFVDRELRLGEVVLRGVRLCEPCQDLEDYIGKPNVIKGLVHRAGLRCEIVAGGVIRVGDEVAPA